MKTSRNHINRLILGACFVFLPFLSGCLPGGFRENYIKTADGVNMAYQYHSAPDEKGVVILVHGLGSTLSEWYYFEETLHSRGWSTFSFDLRGHGFSTQWRGEEIDWREFRLDFLKTGMQDIERAMEFVKESENIWIAGASFGANLALAFAAGHDEVAGAVLLSPGFAFGGITSQPAVAVYGQRPLLLVGARDDHLVAQTCDVLYETARQPKEMFVYDEGGHGTELLDSVPELEEDIIEWMNQQSAA